MKKTFVPAKTRKEATKKMPRAILMVKAEHGYFAFDNAYEYKAFMGGKYSKRHEVPGKIVLKYLVITRKARERIIINDGQIIIEVLGNHGGEVRLSIGALPEIIIDREEVHLRKLAAKKNEGK